MKQKVSAIIDILKSIYPNPVCALHYTKDYELMIAVRLSAHSPWYSAKHRGRRDRDLSGSG